MSECQWGGCYEEATHVLIQPSLYHGEHWPVYYCEDHGSEALKQHRHFDTAWTRLLSLEEYEV